MTTRPARVSEETRLSLAGVAQGAAKANRPRYLIVGAAGCCAVALAALGFALAGLSAARQTLAVERATQAEVAQLVDRLQALREDDEKVLGDKVLATNPFLYTEMERLAREVGLKVGARDIQINQSADGALSATDKSLNLPITRKTFTANPQNPQEIELLLRWATRVTAELPGVRLSALELVPAQASVDGKPRVTGTIQFARWEKR